jgi:hypothetical protein
MKKNSNFYQQVLFPTFLIIIAFASCQQSDDNPPLSCPNMKMIVNTQNSSSLLQLRSNVIFRQHTDSGGFKYMSTEAVSDSLKVIFNLRDGMFEDPKMVDDSLHLKTYTYVKGIENNGLVVVALKNNGGYDYLQTDSSSITLTRMNLKKQTVSGEFYFKAQNGAVTGNGTFENACYTPLN